MLPGVLCCSTLAALRWNELRCLPAVPAAAPHCPPRPPQPHPRTSDPLRARSELNHQFVEAGAAESEVAQQMAVLLKQMQAALPADVFQRCVAALKPKQQLRLQALLA